MSRFHTVILMSLLLSTLACSGGDGEEIGVDAGSGADAGLADAGSNYADGDWLFEEDRIVEVVIEMPDLAWDGLRLATRDILEILGEDCGAGPAPEAFTYQSGSVTIEGERFENVGLRKKGFLGSLDDNKPSLKIKMDEYVANQTLSGLSRFTLNNAVQDASYVNQCIGYKLFRSAGIPAPRCNFANVTVNGENLGLYVHVEDVKKPFLRGHFGDDGGNLYEGTLSDFRDGWMATFEKKTNKTSLATPEIDELESAMLLDGDELRSALAPLVDVESFMRFWALETLVAHGDGYTGNNNNFYIYDDPSTDKLMFMPWGMDQLFTDSPGNISAVRTRSILPNKLFAHVESRAEYVAAMTDILDNTWDDNEVLSEIARIETLIRPKLLAGEVEAFEADIASLRVTVTGREAEIRAQLAGLSAQDAEALMDPLCFEKEGTIIGSFATTWEAAGSADLDVVLGGTSLVFSQQSSVAVPSDDTPGQGVIAVFGDLADGSRSLLFLPLALSEVAPSTLVIKNGAMLFYPPGSEDFDRVAFVSGTLTLTEASTNVGQPVVGSVDFDVWKSPFF